MTYHPRGLLLILTFMLGACASTGATGPLPSVATTTTTAATVTPVDEGERTRAILTAPNARARDRAAILAMLGEYAVRFDFQETVALQSGYEKRADKTSDAHEVVILIEDAGDRLVLQHLLVVGDGHVVKHWRQDWHYQARERLTFSEEQTWRLQPVAADRVEGHWTQCVFEVSDAPRYCGTGRWNHRYGVSTWTSDRSWRPLPRREYTQRSDYNALNVENRHTITPSGWTHEQDNTKVLRVGEKTSQTLVREFGFNDYRRVDAFDFSPAYRYWEQTQDYWAGVRAEWERRITAGKGIRLLTSVDGMAIISPLFEQAQRIQEGRSVADAEMLAVFEAQTAPPETAALALSDAGDERDSARHQAIGKNF